MLLTSIPVTQRSKTYHSTFSEKHVVQVEKVNGDQAGGWGVSLSAQPTINVLMPRLTLRYGTLDAQKVPQFPKMEPLHIDALVAGIVPSTATAVQQ